MEASLMSIAIKVGYHLKHGNEVSIDGTRKALKRLESFETLEVQLNPPGNDTAIFKDMQKWAKNWSQQSRKAH
jgi:hypothetical protein